MSDQANKPGAVRSAGLVSVLASVLVSVVALVWKIKAHQSVLSFLWVGVFYALAKANCPILSMRSGGLTLEESFLRLTEGGED